MIALKLMPVSQSYWTLKDADIVSSIFWWEFLEGFSHAVLFFFFLMKPWKDQLEEEKPERENYSQNVNVKPKPKYILILCFTDDLRKC